jgi:hypothetical protein
MLQNDEDIDEDVSLRIKINWLKWRQAFSVLYDPMVPLKKENSIGVRSDWSCCIEQNVGLLRCDMFSNYG